MPESFILALDQGTTSSRAILFDRSGRIRQTAQKEFQQYYPQPGWVEHDPEEIWSSQYGVLAEVLAKAGITTKEIAAIGITNQRETTVVWDRSTGRAIHPAIVWQDRRTAGYCDELKAQGLSGLIRERTGLVIDAYFSATKLKWILDQVPGARARAAGRAGLWDGRQLACLEADRRQAAYHRQYQCFADAAVQYPYGRVGPRIVAVI
jgi:glycerol kinase